MEHGKGGKTDNSGSTCKMVINPPLSVFSDLIRVPLRFYLLSYLSVAVDDELRGRQIFQPHGAEGVKLGRGDADLCTETQLSAVGKAGLSVHQNRA
jgi:hypothetical protein